MASHFVFQLLEGAHKEEATAVEDSDAIANLLGHGQGVRRHEDRHPLGRFPPQEVFDHPDALGVQADHRFVDHQDFWVVQEGGGKHQPLLHAMRIALCQIVHESFQFETGDLPIHLAVRRRCRHPVHGRDEFQKFAPRQLVIQIRFVWYITDALFRQPRFPDHVMPADADASLAGPQQPHHHLDAGRLARSVGAQVSEQFAAGDRQIQFANRHPFAVRPRDIFKFDHVASGVGSSAQSAGRESRIARASSGVPRTKVNRDPRISTSCCKTMPSSGRTHMRPR